MNKPKILIIDDEQINLEFFNVMFSRLGFDVLLASHGEEGLDLALDNHPDLIILDIVMPGMSGWEVIEHIKNSEEYESCKNIPIIMFSAMDETEDKIRGFEMGIEDYITKPFNFSEVFARIRAVLKQRELAKKALHHEKIHVRSDSLKSSLKYFTEHLKVPVEELIDRARTLDMEDPDNIKSFRDKVVDECEQTLAAIAGLADKVQEIEKQNSSDIENSRTFLADLDLKFKQHYDNLHK